MRKFDDVLAWYRSHKTKNQIGFDPNGMCLKICRTAAGKPPLYPSAKASQDATPSKYRVHRVRDLRRGMVLYFDDPNDSNRFGHVATMIGRVRGSRMDDLSGVLVETNGVKSHELVVVRGDYFQKHWGDPFQFGATWLNGSEIDHSGRPNPQVRKTPPNRKLSRGTRVDNALKEAKLAKATRGSVRARAIASAINALEAIPYLKKD